MLIRLLTTFTVLPANSLRVPAMSGCSLNTTAAVRETAGKYVLILTILLSFNLPVVAVAWESAAPLRDLMEVNSATVEAGDGEADTDTGLNPCWYRVADDIVTASGMVAQTYASQWSMAIRKRQLVSTDANKRTTPV